MAVVEHFLVDAVKPSLALVNFVVIATDAVADVAADAVDDKDEGFLSIHSELSECNFCIQYLYPVSVFNSALNFK